MGGSVQRARRQSRRCPCRKQRINDALADGALHDDPPPPPRRRGLRGHHHAARRGLRERLAHRRRLTARNAYATVGTSSKYAGSYGARLAGATWIERAVDTTGVVGLQLQFAVRTSGLDKGESLLVEWWDGAAWNSLTSSRATRWGTTSVALPAAAGKLSSFKLRFRLAASATDEYADLDSISFIGTPEGTDI